MNNEEGKMVMDYATQKYAPETTEETTPTEIVETPTPESATEAPESTEIVEQTTTDTAPITTTEEVPVDYAKILSEVTEGQFTDVEQFKASLPKLKEYDSLSGKVTELEEKLKVNPFANDFAKTVNDLIGAGKSADEIDNFIKISRLDIDQLPAVDAKVMRMVKDGYNPEIARQIVESDYPINDFEEGSVDRQILEEKLRVSSIDDRKILKEYKQELTTVDNSAQVQAEQERLNNIAKAEQHKQSVKAVVPKIAETIVGLGEKNLNGKEGDEAIKLKFDYNAEFKAQLPAKLESFFLDGGLEVNEENIAFAQKYIRAEYLEKNEEALFQQVFKHAEALTTERLVAKYENLSGLPPEPTNVVVDNTQKAYADFLTKVATGR